MPLSDRDRRTLTIGGIVAGVLLVGVLLMNLLGGGGGEEAPSSLPPTGGGGTSTPSVTPTPSPPPVSPVPIFAGRDPFSIPPGFPTSGGGSPTGGPSSPTGTSTSPTSPPTSPTGTSSGPPTGSTGTPSAPGGGSSSTMGGHQVVVLDVYVINGVEHADISVDGTVYHPAEGQRFGPSQQFQLTNVSGSCATVLFGDESHTLCITPQK